MRGGVDAAADPDGGPRPRRWWNGPLDVERLAWDAVVAARDAVRALAGARGQDGEAGTTPALVAASFAALDHLRVEGAAVPAWAAHPHGAATRDEPWASVAPGGPRRRLRGGRLPLEGVRILDLTRVVAGPAAAQLAACGIADACGRDGEPGALPVQALDHATGHRLFAETVRLLAQGRAGVVRISLLGAARTLLGLSPPPPGPAAELPVPRVEMGSEAGRLDAVPPAIALDGEVLARDVGAYGGVELRWP